MYTLWLTSFACRFAPPHAQLPKSFPTDYPATFCSVSNPTAASAECIASLKLQFFSPDNAVTICQGASSKAPAEMCANDKSISSSLNSDQIASLCPSSTTSDAPPKCFKKVRLGDESYLLSLKSFIHSSNSNHHPRPIQTITDTGLFHGRRLSQALQRKPFHLPS